MCICVAFERRDEPRVTQSEKRLSTIVSIMFAISVSFTSARFMAEDNKTYLLRITGRYHTKKALVVPWYDIKSLV